jgi:hypothetical protein
MKALLPAIILTAILIPAGMGYAEASGLPPIIGLYATILPLVAYALLGPSRILVLGLAPAAHGGNRTGRVFTGDASGDFLWPAPGGPRGVIVSARRSPSRVPDRSPVGSAATAPRSLR